MTVADRDNLTISNVVEAYHPTVEEAGDGQCFHCGTTLRRVSVFWSGRTPFWLHPECAQAVALMLIKDAFNAVSIEKGYTVLRGIVPSLGGPLL